MSTEARDYSNHCIYLKNNALYNEAARASIQRHFFSHLPMQHAVGEATKDGFA